MVEGFQPLHIMAVQVADHFFLVSFDCRSPRLSLQMHCDICILFTCVPNMPIGELTCCWAICNIDTSVHECYIFVLSPSNHSVLMSKHLSFSHTYSNNRCEPFKDGCIIVPKRTKLTSLGRAAKKRLIAIGFGLFFRSWVKGSDTQETVPRHFSNPHGVKEFQLTSVSLFRLTQTRRSSHWLLKVTINEQWKRWGL